MFLGLFDVLGAEDDTLASGDLGDAALRREDSFDCCDAYDDGIDTSWEDGDCFDW